MLLHTSQMDAWLLFLFLYLHVSFTLSGSVFSAVKEEQVLLLVDVQSQLCEWVKLQQRCRLVSVYSMLPPVIYIAHLSWWSLLFIHNLICISLLHKNFMFNMSFIGLCVICASLIPKCSPAHWTFGLHVLYTKAQVSLNVSNLDIINFELILEHLPLNIESTLLKM